MLWTFADDGTNVDGRSRAQSRQHVPAASRAGQKWSAGLETVRDSQSAPGDEGPHSEVENRADSSVAKTKFLPETVTPSHR